MSIFQLEGIALAGIAVTVPPRIVSNSDLKAIHKDERKKLIDTIGISSRREADNGITASDLCVDAAKRLLKDLEWEPSEIELLIYVSQTPDYLIPSNSMHIQERLGLGEYCNCFDLNQGCAGYVYGLSLIGSQMKAGGLKKGLLLVGDTITRFIDRNDNSLRPIFSDAGSATGLILDPTAKMHFNLESIGSGYEHIIVKGGGARNPLKANTTQFPNLEMKGLEVFNFTLTRVLSNIKKLMTAASLNENQVRYFCFHQANQLILDMLTKKLGTNSSKVPSSLFQYGNTSGVTIPLTLACCFGSQGSLANGIYFMSGFGVGLSIGSLVVDCKDVLISEINVYGEA